MLGHGGMAAVGCRAIAVVIVCASVFQGCLCPAHSSGCQFGGSTGCDTAPAVCDGLDCDGGARPDAGDVPHDAGVDAGPSALCAPGVCNVLSSVGCPATLACRLPVTATDAGVRTADAGASASGLVCDPFGTGRSSARCAGDGDCAPGFMCWPVVGGGRCRAYCCGGNGCPAGEECRTTLTPGIQLCAAPVECDPVAQTGCLPGFACNVWSSTQTGCDPAGGLPEGATCASRLDCAPGLGCGPMLASVCRRYCDPSDPTSCGHGTCSPLEPDAGLCQPSAAGPCDPLHQLDCPDGTSCYPDGLGHVQCASTGTVAPGNPCSSPSDCVAGAACTDDLTGTLRCAALCDLASGAPCAGATHCTSKSGYPTGVGACL